MALMLLSMDALLRFREASHILLLCSLSAMAAALVLIRPETAVGMASRGQP
jgi:hypothetical protein